jgi:hypothetical protein
MVVTKASLMLAGFTAFISHFEVAPGLHSGGLKILVR